MRKFLFAAVFFACLCVYGESLELYKSRVENAIVSLKPALKEKTLVSLCELAKQVRKIESQHSNHYQVITAQDHLYLAYQMVLEEIYEKTTPLFFYLRGKDSKLYNSLTPFFDKYPHFFEEKDISTVDLWRDLNDSDPNISYQLLSASLGLEIACEGESAISIFLNGMGVFQNKQVSLEERRERISKQIIAALPFSCNAKQKSCILNIVKRCPYSPFGILMQIFIPKERVGSYLYASRPYGYVDVKANSDLNAFFSAYAASRESDSFDPGANYQVRLLAGALNSREILMYRYVPIEQEKLQNYRTLIRQTLKEIAQKEVLH